MFRVNWFIREWIFNICLSFIFALYSAQSAGLLCEEAGKLGDNVKFCGYCKNHYQKIVSRKILKKFFHSIN